MLITVAAVSAALVATWLVRRFHAWCKRLEQEMQVPMKMILEDPAATQNITPPSIFNEASKTLSVIVPAYNEQDRLPSAMEELLSYLKRRRDREGPHFTYEVIIVDDGSRDQTSRVAYELVKAYGFDAVRLLRSTANRGKGHAVKQGVMIARGATILFMDADGATKVSEMDRLEAALKQISTDESSILSPKEAAVRQGPMGVVVGSRAHMEQAAAAKRSALRNLLTKGFHLLVLLVAGGAIRDTQCGFKMFTRRSAAVLFGNMRLQQWCFDVELLLLAKLLWMPVAEVQVEWTEIAGSKIRFTSIITMALELLAVKASYQILGTWKIYSEVELMKKAR